jgi:hypothetical protein
MCQRLYIASRSKLETVRKTKAAPFLSVRALSDDAHVRQRFGPDRAFLYLAEAHVECGCGFPVVAAEPSGPERRTDPADLQSLQALAQYLRRACRGHSTAEIYLCWAHEESEPPLSRRTVSLADLANSGFRLRHRELLTVGRAT